jgi:hypothetical protein
MNLKINLDFCVIPSPYNKGLRNLVFIAYKGTNRIDEKLCLENDYELIVNFLKQYGYQEIEFCVFESSDNTTIRIEELKYKLIESGMRYSKPFEFNIMGELESFHLDLMAPRDVADVYPVDNNVYFSTTTPSVTSQIKSKIPAVGEKITLHFYLFLQCHWVNENDCVLELVGDLYSKENNNTRNFLQITKSDFVRLDSNVPNTIMLQSTKSYGDFINEINILHKGKFRHVKPAMSQNGDMVMKTKEFTYNIIEIKKNINPIHRIVVEANLNQYYDSMISVSKKIKKELSIEQKRIMSLEVVRPEILLLKQKLKDKMLILAESDEFEKASVVKNDINFIDNKIKFIDNLEEKNITREEYFKTFCLNP